MYHFNDDRVSWEPAPVKTGDSVFIKYHGLLRNAGADGIYLHCGVDGWKNTQTVPMMRMPEGVFTAQVQANAAHELNICFKDSANNWDNNSGWNWKVDVI